MKNIFGRYLFLLLCVTAVSYAEYIHSTIVGKNDYRVINPNKTGQLKVLKQKGGYVSIPLFEGEWAVKWARKFNIAELGNFNDDRFSENLLKKAGIASIKHHIAYDWMPGVYYNLYGSNGKFVSWLYKNRNFATLNPKGPFIHCRKNHYDWCNDYYYDLGNPKVFERRVKNLIDTMKAKGFNGIFFDWGSGGYILDKEYKSVYSNFKKLNPNKNYFKLIGAFYKRLREDGIFVVTNQAFRKERYLLPFVTYDMTESYITTNINIKKSMQIQGVGALDTIDVTDYYPIDNNSKTLQKTLFYIDLLEKYKKEYKKEGFKNFVYLNYLAPVYKPVYNSDILYREVKPKNGIYFSYAMAKLTDSLVYAEVPDNRKLERDDVYFYKLSKVLGERYEKLDGIDAYVRFYKNGFVLASAAYGHDIYLKLSSRFLPQKAEIYDAFNNVWIQAKSHTVILKLHYAKSIFKHTALPLGRVYLYAR
jgi:hypothetical protein